MAINRDLFIKILLPSLIVVSLVITIVKELRTIGIVFFALGSVAWAMILIGKIRFLTKDEEIDKLLKYFVYPAMVFNVILLFISEEYRGAGAGWIYLILGGFTILLYLTPSLRDSVVGINKKVTKSVMWGIGIAFGFLFTAKIFPQFSLLTPELPFSLLEGVRAIVIIGFAPIFEASLFRGAILPALQQTYGLSFGVSNIIQASGFGSYHLLVYGVVLSALQNLTELFGATLAISGSLIAAVGFALIMGYFVRKYGITTELVTHPLINGVLFFSVLSVGSFFSIG